VTGLALGFLGVGVDTVEWKIRVCVVKGRFVDRGDALPSPFVVCVAVLTFPLLLHPAMKPLLAFHILTDIFMTILA
jgi:hypothetical protein